MKHLNLFPRITFTKKSILNTFINISYRNFIYQNTYKFILIEIYSVQDQNMIMRRLQGLARKVTKTQVTLTQLEES
jgi:hypothetical protein